MKTKIICEKLPKNYGAKVYWQVFYGSDSDRKYSILFKSKKKALEFAKTKLEETTSPFGIYIDFLDSSQSKNKMLYAQQNELVN